MGGVVPLGYRVEDRALRIVDDHAAIVQVPCFAAISRREAWCASNSNSTPRAFKVPIRINGGGRSTGGGLFSRGHVYELLVEPDLCRANWS